MSTKEIWRVVPSLPEVLASSLGRVMVTPYQQSMPFGGLRQYGGEPTSGQWDGRRYLSVFKGRTYKLHRLVCEAFHGEPATGQVCMHIDENAANNRPENLAWGLQKENLNAPGFIAYCKQRTGDRNPWKKGQRRRWMEATQ